MLRVRLGKSDIEALDWLCEYYEKSRSEIMRALLRRSIQNADPFDNLFNPNNYEEEGLQFSEDIIPIDEKNNDELEEI